MKFEWDEDKNQINLQKHGIDFNDVPELFNHPLLTMRDDRFGYLEERWISLGALRTFVSVVVHTERRQGIIRIISARKATRQEAKRYVQSIKN